MQDLYHQPYDPSPFHLPPKSEKPDRPLKANLREPLTDPFNLRPLRWEKFLAMCFHLNFGLAIKVTVCSASTAITVLLLTLGCKVYKG